MIDPLRAAPRLIPRWNHDASFRLIPRWTRLWWEFPGRCRYTVSMFAS